jgi:Rad3-related DNA helicase
LKIKFSSSERDYIKIRHDASTAAMKAEFESKDMEARGGSIGSWYVFCDILSYLDNALATKLRNDYRTENEKYKKEAKKLKEELEAKLKRLKKEDAKKMARAEFDEQRGALSAMMITNVIFPPLIKWLEANNKSTNNSKDYVVPADRFIQELFKYITSRSTDSGKFIIAK